MAAVVEVNSLDELDHYHLVWKSLLPETRCASFYQTLDYLRAYWQHYGHGNRLRVLIVYSAGEAIGILPLAVMSERTRFGPLDVLTYPLHQLGCCYGPIGPSPTATLFEGMSHLRQSRRDWDILHLRGIDVSGCDHGRTRNAMQMAGFPAQQDTWKKISRVDVTGSWSHYWSSRSPSMRRLLRRYEGRCRRLGEVRHVHYRPLGRVSGDIEPRWDLFQACLDVLQANQSTVSLPDVQFARQTHQLAVDAGALDLHVMFVRDTPAAFLYNYRYQGRVVQLHSGCATAFQRRGLLKVLLQRALQSSFASEDRVYEFSEQSPIATGPWSTHTTSAMCYRYYPPAAARAQLLRVTQWLAKAGAE